jgi:hypothetical protein
MNALFIATMHSRYNYSGHWGTEYGEVDSLYFSYLMNLSIMQQHNSHITRLLSGGSCLGFFQWLTWLHIYNYVKSKCVRTETRNFVMSSLYVATVLRGIRCAFRIKWGRISRVTAASTVCRSKIFKPTRLTLLIGLFRPFNGMGKYSHTFNYSTTLYLW